MSGSTNGSRAGYETARLALARLRLTGTDARHAALRQVAEIGARALGVARTSIWTASDAAAARFRCESAFEVAGGRAAFEGVSEPRSLAALVAALAERRVLSVPDAASDPRTVELRDRTVGEQRIQSLLAATIIRDGAVAGFVCFKHAGEPRAWSQTDRDFAASAADMAALFLEQADRLSIEAALRERRELELVRHKMVALERLARSVVHDVNNVLAALEMIGATIELDGRPDVAQHGADVRRFVGLGGQLVQQLSLFGGEAVGPTELIDVRGLLREVEPVLARVVGAARFELDVTTAATVAIPRTELQQVLLNLCVNAGEAIASHPSPRGSGVVRVELREPRADEPISPTAVVLAVADDGRGMDAETQAHIFEPYFSRKQSGRGIGLAIVYGIVERAGGTILVDSAPGRGTTFRVVLPRSFDLPASGA